MLTTNFIVFFVVLAICGIIYADNIVGDSEYSVQILKNNDKNVIFSPLSINTAFGMLYIGAQGESKAQLKRSMFNNMSDDELLAKVSNLSDVFNARSGGYNVTLANQVWAKKDFPFLESYTSTLRTKFSSDIIPVEKFGDPTVSEINRWVEEKTNNKIKDILKPGSLKETTRLALVNTLHLKAEWVRKFLPGSTSDETFQSSPGKNVTVQMMKRNPDIRYYPYFENQDVQILRLDCVQESAGVGPQLAMFVVLPKERFGLKGLASKGITLTQLASLAKQTESTAMSRVWIPKFKIEFGLNLVDTLRSAGIRDIFDETKADLSKINGQRNLYVSAAVHKAFIEVAESGVEAAAATVIVTSLIRASFPTPVTKDFVADHPFLFAIVDTRDYTPLFLGKFVGN